MRHPLHPAFAHFPVACWSLAVAADFASLWLGEAAWRWSGGLLAVGCAVAVLAMLAGMVELPRVPDGAPMRDAWTHMSAMLAAFTFFAARLLLGLDHLRPVAPDQVSLLLDAGGFIALLVGGWFAGRLVYGHGVGRDRPE
ncbi:DUF2231 domain-containing protein [Pikeienuella sp. HZG-20]|uniref:DUF2231 domain-containing protein n=1 Tax=Paludibacillus litoralis TaxID=3133267 RepID=UPI0030EB5BAF